MNVISSFGILLVFFFITLPIVCLPGVILTSLFTPARERGFRFAIEKILLCLPILLVANIVSASLFGEGHTVLPAIVGTLFLMTSAGALCGFVCSYSKPSKWVMIADNVLYSVIALVLLIVIISNVATDSRKVAGEQQAIIVNGTQYEIVESEGIAYAIYDGYAYVYDINVSKCLDNYSNGQKIIFVPRLISFDSTSDYYPDGNGYKSEYAHE